MSKWLRIDGSAGDAYLRATIGAGAIGSGFSVDLDVFVPATTVSAIGSGGSTAEWFQAWTTSSFGGIFGAITPGPILKQFSELDSTAHGTLPQDTVFHLRYEAAFSSGTTWDFTTKVDGVTVTTFSFDTGENTTSIWSHFDVGALATAAIPGEVYYVSNAVLRNGSGTLLFSDDFTDVTIGGDLGPWTSSHTASSLSIVDDVPGGSGTGDTFTGPVRVGVAFDDVALEPSPAWTYLNNGSSRVASYSIDRGRQFEFDKTDAGTATVKINDRDGTLDPTNTAGPYFGKLEPLLQIKIDLWNPVTLEYQTRFRGWIEDYTYQVETFTHQDAADNTVGLTRLEISCVDIFEILTAIEMQPDGSFGDDPATATYADATGNIFFAVTDGQGRIDQVLGNAGIDPSFYVAFTLNIHTAEAVYSPSENVLQVIQDVADAEFPTVANAYTDRFGRLAIHGRLAKFDPAGTAASAAPGAWDFTEWKAGDGKAVTASPSDTAHIREFSYNRGLSMIRNSALCTPNHIDDPPTTPGKSDIPGQHVTDTPSIAQYGIRSWSAENLFVEDGILTGNSALDETRAFAEFVIANYAEPRNRITDIVFKSMHPDAEGAAANWDLLCRADISDLVDVYIRGAGDTDTGYIFNGDPFFIEGVHEEASPATGEYAYVTMSLDLSPQAYFTTGTGVT